MSQNPIEPYKPNYSPSAEPTRREEREYREPRQTSGCFKYLVAGIFAMLLGIGIIAVTVIFSVGSLGKAMDALCLYNCTSDVVEVNVQPFILALKQEAFLETLRSEQVYEIYASNEMPGIVPGRRSLRYKAFMTITAGVDLQLVNEADFSTDGTSITISLPKPQLRDCVLDSQQSFYYERACNYVGCGGLEQVLVDRAYEMPVSEGYDLLLAEAWENAVEAVTDIAVNFGYENVNVQQSSTDVFYVSADSTCKIPPELLPQPTPTPIP